MTVFNTLADLEARQIIPGFHGRFIHTDHVTFAYWEIDAGARLPPHAHPQEQITMVLEGTFELTVADDTRTVTPGGVAVIPGGVAHSGRALTACRLIDVFHPVRDDYR